MRHRFSIYVLFGMLLALSAQASSHLEIEVIDPWIREAPPGVRVLGGYLTIQNHGTKDRTIVSASSPRFQAVEIHRTEMQDGNARMVREEPLHVLAGETVRFEPGGLHLMLMMPTEGISLGDTIELSFELEQGGALQFLAVVRKEVHQ